eukprot:253602_1
MSDNTNNSPKAHKKNIINKGLTNRSIWSIEDENPNQCCVSFYMIHKTNCQSIGVTDKVVKKKLEKKTRATIQELKLGGAVSKGCNGNRYSSKNDHAHKSGKNNKNESSKNESDKKKSYKNKSKNKPTINPNKKNKKPTKKIIKNKTIKKSSKRERSDRIGVRVRRGGHRHGVLQTDINLTLKRLLPIKNKIKANPIAGKTNVNYKYSMYGNASRILRPRYPQYYGRYKLPDQIVAQIRDWFPVDHFGNDIDTCSDDDDEDDDVSN